MMLLAQHLEKLRSLTCVLMLVSILSGCSGSSLRQVSYDRLKQEGFYVYVLPEDEIAEQGWRQEITMRSFDHHCHGLTEDETYNPIQIRYVNLSESPPSNDLPRAFQFSVHLGPWPPPWASGGEWTEVAIESQHIEGKRAWYKEWPDSMNGTFLGLVFDDVFGQPVYVSSWLSLAETMSLVSKLNYVGPPPDTVTNPWDCWK